MSSMHEAEQDVSQESEGPEVIDVLAHPPLKKERRLQPHTIGEIMARYRRHLRAGDGAFVAYQKIGTVLGIQVDTVRAVVKRMTSTSAAAEAHLQASALKLAMRIVRKANVEESIDILSRPNIGVLSPIAKGTESTAGIFIGVSADSCGAVKVGVSLNGSPAENPAGLPAVDMDLAYLEEEDRPVVEVSQKSPQNLNLPNVPHPHSTKFQSKATREAAERLRVRLEVARQKKDQRAVRAAKSKLKKELEERGHAKRTEV